MNDYDFIIYVKDILSISKICKENNIDYANLSTGRSTKENEKIVADELKKLIYKIYGSIIVDKIIE